MVSELLTPVRSTQFKRDVARARRRGKHLAKLRALLTALVRQHPLPARYRDHALRGPWTGYRDVHLEPDWILIYRVREGKLYLARTGTHADLFRE
ncbi:MAG: type II toxin-antitoxin system YafQ family toxin [Rhodospirillales bacterium]|nr:type II toxin-antitoxin system YafQ family toxin [Rhodospirillales bacterium]